MRKFIIKIVCLVLGLFIALNAVTQLLTMSNTVANIAGIVLLEVCYRNDWYTYWRFKDKFFSRKI